MDNSAADRREPEAIAVAAARIADHEHGTDIVVLNVGAVTIVAEYFVVISATNRRLARRLTEQIESELAIQFDEKPLRREGLGEFEWVVMDYGNVMVHIFGEEAREFYEIERLYGDVPVARWQEATSPSDVADPDGDDTDT